MKQPYEDQGQRLVGLAVLLCIGTAAISGIMAMMAATNSEFIAAGICMIPASIASGALLHSLS